MARTKKASISTEDRKVIGSLLRGLRRSSGYRSVEAAATTAGCPASRQTIYQYERGGLTPSLAQFLELTEFFVLTAPAGGEGAKAEPDLRALGVAAVVRVLELPAYHVAPARALMAQMQPGNGRAR